MTDIMTPALGESVTEATVARWAKRAGDAIKRDELLVELETDKVSLEVVAPEDGVLSGIDAEEGATVVPGQRLGQVEPGSASQAAGQTPAPISAVTAASSGPPPAAAPPTAPALSPSVRRIVAGERPWILRPCGQAAGMRSHHSMGDAMAAVEAKQAAASAAPPPPTAPALASAPSAPLAIGAVLETVTTRAPNAREERVRMTRLRQTIARRLKEAQQTAAMLTTFNEVDMSAVMALRSQYKDAFEKRHGVKLGFMGLFVKACVAALREVPSVNAEIDGQDLIYKNHYDVGVAVGTERGLVVPVVRDADLKSIAEIEAGIAALGKKARDGALAMEDLQGGTFTISNGGVYGSLMSTPILNAPQSGILGMHKIQDRPVAIGGQVVIRPMMYLALSYDHRVVDGQGAVTFLVKVKDHIEDPQRLLLEI